jgi:hypothetical protein
LINEPKINDFFSSKNDVLIRSSKELGTALLEEIYSFICPQIRKCLGCFGFKDFFARFKEYSKHNLFLISKRNLEQMIVFIALPSEDEAY